ncbi:hypothetical protein [Arcticibacterium luteifluviistationis]|uniref:STAS domain-containing protein n=1 Tax=Arcticibacterium luteifluviistationis TaxID=1784714 RepID=A0A2Z4GCG4_9BACT|nr:hypothetical protein [Arcticibacterium luteifluviistationis]AWV98603.1 hypothetical protein DJ013_10655 [Arcticibacterium luteifluviistationis]
MSFKLDISEEIISVVFEEKGKSLAALTSEIPLEKLSVIVDYDTYKFGVSDLGILQKWNEKIKGYDGLLVLTGEERTEVEGILYLPTFHEAKEAIFMNDLENQFLKEMGE